MKIEQLIWLEEIIDKLYRKHHVSINEVEEVFLNRPKILYQEKGKRKNEDVYCALGVTNEGRNITVFFIYKSKGKALILSARDMSQKERKRYERK